MPVEGEEPAAIPAGDEHDGPAPAATRRASAPVTLGAMTLVALVVTGGLVVWMRMPAPAGATRAQVGVEEEVPTTLAGGLAPAVVPAAIASAVDRPVIGASTLEALPDGSEGCGFDLGDDAELERAVATPDGLAVSLIGDAPDGFLDGPMPRPEPEPAPPPPDTDQAEVGEQAPRWRETCVLRDRGGRWFSDGGSSGPADDRFGGMGTSVLCCDEQGFALATTELHPLDGAAWVLQDRGAYWLAYPVAGADRLTLTWRFREGGFGRAGATTYVRWLDDAGGVIDEQHLRT
jgi:hypothetical protein